METPKSSSDPADHYPVVWTLDACRLLWHKTREKARRKIGKRDGIWGVVGVMESMCGCTWDPFTEERPDLKIEAVTLQHTAATIRKLLPDFIEAMIVATAGSQSKLAREFKDVCRRMGRNVRVREFVRTVERIYTEWAEEPDWEMALCPFPREIDEEAAALDREIANELVQWTHERIDAIEAVLRRFIDDHVEDDSLLSFEGGEAESREEVLLHLLRRRKTPPLRKLIPANACLKIHRMLVTYREEAQQDMNDENRHELTELAMRALDGLLKPYRENLRIAGVTSLQVIVDVLNHDVHLSAEELLKGRRGD